MGSDDLGGVTAGAAAVVRSLVSPAVEEVTLFRPRPVEGTR